MRRRVGKVLLVGLFALVGGLLFDFKSNKEYSNVYVGDTYLSRVEKEAWEGESVTHKGVVYLDPTNLSRTCTIDDVVSTKGTKSGCMRFYIYDVTDTTYKMILDHNTSATNVAWVTKEDYVNSFEAEEQEAAAARYDANPASFVEKGAITVQNQLAADTAGWAGNPRLLSLSDVVKIANNPSYDELTGYNLTTTYGWLYDGTSTCTGCHYPELTSGVSGYWTTTSVEGTTSRAWAVTFQGRIASAIAKYDGSYGVRPVIELKKDQVDGAFKLTQSTFDTPTNGVSVYEDAYCLTAGKYQLEEDITLSKSIALKANCGLDSTTDVVIDLNGNTLTLGDYEFATEGPNLNITGSGEIVGNVLILDGTVTLDDSVSYTGTIDIRGGETTIDGISVNSTTNALVINDGATVTINHGDFTGITFGLLVRGGTIGISSASFAANAYAVAITDTMSFEDLLVNPNVFNDIDTSSDYIEADGFKKLNTAETSVGIKTTYTLDFDTYNVDENGRVLFTNDNIEPGIEVKVGDDTLVEGTDYTVEYKNNKNVGEASVVIKRISTSAYAFANKTLKFEIYKIAMDMDKLEVAVQDEDDIVYTGSAIIPTFTLLYDTVAFNEIEENFDIAAEDNVNAGTATYTLTLKDSSVYTSENSKVFTVTIKKKEIAANELSLQIGFSAATYTGSAITSSNVQLQYGLDYLDAENYEVTYANNINVGEATVTATSKDNSNYSFVKSETFTINPKTLDENNITLDHIKYEYTGEDIEPGVTVTDGTTEINRSDYTLVYLNNRAIGSGQIHVVSVDGANYTFNEVMAFDIVEEGSVTIVPVDNLYNASLLNSEDDLETIIPLTLDETARRAEGEEIVVYIEVENIAASELTEDKNKILAGLEENNLVYQFIDISLYKKVGDSAPVKVTAPTGKIKIQFNIPESLLNNKDIENIYVVRLHDGVVSVIPIVIVDGKGVIETDGFSTYALAYKVKAQEVVPPTETTTTQETTTTSNETPISESNSNNPKTGDNIRNITVLMILSMASMFYINYKKRVEL